MVTLVASAVSSTAVCWLIFARFTDGVGWFGFLVSAFLLFLATYYLVTLDQHGRLVATDRVVAAIVICGAALLLVPLAWLIGYVIVRGLPALRLSFLFH
ncbi:MAG: phosphate ABC transporter, permease protein PstA, partial [Actinomycetota bacterium]|nr:phosphate ABC transporter, permease protein PstA [Actinomycetota bacterium]